VKPAILFLAAALVTACSVDHRSGDFTCTRQADCTGNRVCMDGFCIDPTAPDAASTGADAPPGHPDAAGQCPAECTSCAPDQMICTIDCSTNACNSGVVCPAGWNCDIKCGRDNSCRAGIDCQDAASCTVSCGGQDSCRNIQCGFGACDVSCTGQGSCRGVDCHASCACDVGCIGQGSCGDAVQCPLGCDTGLGCSSQPFTCNVCL